MQGNILIVDDNKSVLASLNLFLKSKVNRVITCSTPNQIAATLQKESIDVVLLDMNFSAGINSGNEGLFWMREIHKIDPLMVVILITAYGDIQLAVSAMKEGATDFVLKPWDNQKLLATLRNGVELSRARRENVQLKVQQKELQRSMEAPFQDFVGTSAPMQQVYRTIEKVSKTDANVLILGENGTGKELVARELHRQSQRSAGVFMSVDLGSIAETLFESELFGHVKGAFTDAKEDRVGRFQAASGGTLFLDEIGNLSLPMQAKLLVALQNREITPVGASKSIPVDIRLVCATNKNLSEMVATHQFREDLLYRVNTIQIELPPLRQRDSDIVDIAEYYLAKYAERYGKKGIALSAPAMDAMQQYLWPGNIRELRHTIERAVILCEGKAITVSDLSLPYASPASQHNLGSDPITLDDAERLLIEASLKRNKGNLSNVARELNIGRQTLYRKIEKYGL